MAEPIRYGGIISQDFLEQSRGQFSDAEIARKMAKESLGFSNQLDRINRATNFDDKATTAFLNTRFYGDSNYTHPKTKEKGFIARSLDRIWDNWNKDLVDIETELQRKREGESSFLGASGVVAGNLASIGLSPIAQPAQESIETVGRMALERIPGARETLEDVGQSRFVQEGVVPAFQKVSGSLSREAEQNPSLRALGAMGEAGFDALDVFGANFLRQGAKKLVTGTPAAIRAIPEQSGRTLRGIGKGFSKGLKGRVDDAVVESGKLTGFADEAVKAGMDENVVKFAAQQNADTRAAMGNMTRVAAKESGQLGGSVRHKEILGGHMLENISHLMDTKQRVGKALGGLKAGHADDIVDLTDAYSDFQNVLRSKGAVINNKGKIIQLTGAADDNIPTLQKTLDFLTPDENGIVIRTFKESDMWRAKMFEEMNSARAKLVPSSQGRSALGTAENATNTVRRDVLVKMSGGNNRLIAYNDAFEELSTQQAKFLRAIGYKGKLNAEDVASQQLRAGEVSLRQLGNASAEKRQAFNDLIATARKYGYESNVDEMALVRWADTIEDLFPISPTRSLRGEVSRATRDAAGNLTEDVIRGGARRAGTRAIADKVIDKIDELRGITPERREELLLKILDAPENTSFFSVADDVLRQPAMDDLVDQFGESTLKNVETGDLAKNAAQELLEKGGKKPTLTPEERATGLIGGSDNVPKSADDLAKPPLTQPPRSGGKTVKGGIMFSTRDTKNLRRMKNEITEKGFKKTDVQKFVNDSYATSSYSQLLGKDNIYLVMPSTTGKNTIPKILAKRLKQDFGGEIVEDFALPLHKIEAKSKNVFDKIAKPARYEIHRDIPRNKNIVVVDDVLNTGDTLSGIKKALADKGVEVDDLAVLGASEFKTVTPRDLERMTGKLSNSLDIPENQIYNDVAKVFDGQNKQFFNKAEREITSRPQNSQRIYESIRKNISGDGKGTGKLQQESLQGGKGTSVSDGTVSPVQKVAAKEAGSNVIPDNLKPLAEDARGKSLDDFVKAQQKLFHGTDRVGIETIEKEGFRVPELSREEGLHFSTDKNYAQKFGSNQFEVVLDGKISDKVYPNPSALPSKATIKKQGFDAVRYMEDGRENVYVVSLKKIKTKSQLTEIWKQANQ